MRSVIFALFLTICCIVAYTSAAALPENPSEIPDPAAPVEYNEINEEDASEIAGDVNNNTAEDPQSRTLFLLLPLLFPDQFYFS